MDRVFYFIGILSWVRDVFLPSCPQVLLLLNVRFRGTSESYKNPVQMEEAP